MFEQLITNADPSIVILIVILIVYVGDKIFPKKSEQTKIEKDITSISNKMDGGLSVVRQEFVGAMHNHELKNKDELAIILDKTRKEMCEIWDKVDSKYVSKEINRKQEERLELVEKAVSDIRADVSEMKPYLEKIDMLYDMLKDFINKK